MRRVSNILFSVCSVWTEKYLKMIKTFHPTVEPKSSMIMMAAVVNFSLLRIPSIFHWYVWAGLYKCTLNAPQKWDWVHWATEHCIQLTWGLWIYDIAMKGQNSKQNEGKTSLKSLWLRKLLDLSYFVLCVFACYFLYLLLSACLFLSRQEWTTSEASL